jgi:hypothetical protein
MSPPHSHPSPQRAQAWLQHYAKAVAAASSGDSGQLISPPMKADQTPMVWFDDLDVSAFKFKPVKHRKFVEEVKGASVRAPVRLKRACDVV